jgi:acylphosphatase
MFQYIITVSGEVQGVGYRYFVVREASHLKITGWVKNLCNGDVKLLAEGNKEILDSFLNILKTKHHFARVDNVEILKNEIPKREFSDFDVTFE